MTRRVRTALQRTKLFLEHGGKCYLCGHKIDAVKEGFELEHVIPFELTRDDSDDNLRPAHKLCHKEKTKDDVAVIAKAKRRQAKFLGAKKPKKPWPKRGAWVDNTKNLDGEYVK